MSSQTFYDHETCELARHWIEGQPVMQALGNPSHATVCTPLESGAPDNRPNFHE